MSESVPKGFRFLQIARVGSTPIGVQRGWFWYYGLGTASMFIAMTVVAPDIPLLTRGLVALYPAFAVTTLGLIHEAGHLVVAAWAGARIFAVIFGWWGPAVLRSSGTSRRADAASALAGPCTGLVGACALWVIGSTQEQLIAVAWQLTSVAGIAFNLLQLIPLRFGKLETDGLHFLQALRRK